MELRLERRDRTLDLTRAGPNGARHPVERPELVDDRPLDPRDRVGLELDVAVRVEPLDRADQAEQPVGDEVLLLDVCGEPASEPACHVLHEGRVGQDQAVTKRLVAGIGAIGPPEGLCLVELGAHG